MAAFPKVIGWHVLRAFIAAGKPGARELEPFGSFEEWSDLVRGALVWLGEVDPVATRQAITIVDSGRDILANIMAGIYAANCVGKWETAVEITEAALRAPNVQLRHALEAKFPKGVTVYGLSVFLNRNKDKIINGLRLEVNYDKHAKTTQFRVTGGEDGIPF